MSLWRDVFIMATDYVLRASRNVKSVLHEVLRVLNVRCVLVRVPCDTDKTRRGETLGPLAQR